MVIGKALLCGEMIVVHQAPLLAAAKTSLLICQ